jgi:hypothetical protein
MWPLLELKGTERLPNISTAKYQRYVNGVMKIKIQIFHGLPSRDGIIVTSSYIQAFRLLSFLGSKGNDIYPCNRPWRPIEL